MGLDSCQHESWISCLKRSAAAGPAYLLADVSVAVTEGRQTIWHSFGVVRLFYSGG